MSEKYEYIKKLLRQDTTNNEIIRQVKLRFGSGISHTTLRKLREIIDKKSDDDEKQSSGSNSSVGRISEGNRPRRPRTKLQKITTEDIQELLDISHYIIRKRLLPIARSRRLLSLATKLEGLK